MTQPVTPVLGMILKGFPRISEVFISNEILLLEKHGFRIHIFSMRKPREFFSHQSVKAIRAPVDYLPETLLAPLPRLLYHNARLAAKKPRVYIQALNIAARRFMRTRKSATLKHLLQAGYLVQRQLPGSGVTHLHAHFAHSPTSVAMFTSKLSGLPFSFTAHAKDIYTSDPRQIREKIALSRFVVTCTEHNKVNLEDIARAAATPIHCIYHGIDLDLFSGAAPPRTPSSPYHILTIARLIPKKGLPTILKAIRHLCDQGVDIDHVLIGDGEDRDHILSCIRRLDLEGTTRCLGTLPHHEVLKHYRNSDVFVLGCEIAANGDRDGIPNVLVESMAMGVPVVATGISAIPEIVEDGITGLLVSPGRPNQMARALHRLLTDADLRHRIIPAAHNRVAENFNNKKLIDKLAKVFRAEGLTNIEHRTFNIE